MRYYKNNSVNRTEGRSIFITPSLIFFLSESKIFDFFPVSQFFVESFRNYHKDKTNGGWLLLHVNENLTDKVFITYEVQKNSEIIVLLVYKAKSGYDWVIINSLQKMASHSLMD